MSFLNLRLGRNRADQLGADWDVKVIARQLFDAGLEEDDLFEAMWEHHDRTGLEARHIFAEYKALRTTAA